MDGTLTVSNIDFAAMRERTGIPAGDLFTVMEEWRDAGRVAHAMDIILGLEAEAQRTLQLQPGLQALLEQCVADGLRLAIVTRNTNDAVDALFARLGERWRPAFAPLLTRHFKYVKPDRRLLLHVAQAWGVPPSQLLMVGDSREDVEIGAICGAATCLIAGGGNETNAAAAAAAIGVTPTFAVRSLGELAERLRAGGPGLAAPDALPRGVPFLAALLEASVIAAAACSYPGLGAADRGFAPCDGKAPAVLHVDCGDGAFTKTVHSHGLDARGVDTAEASAEAARARGLGATAVAMLTPGALGADAAGAFDCLLCIAERGAAPSLLFDAVGAARPAALAEALRVLRQGGALAVEWHGAHAAQDAAAAQTAAQQAGFAVRRMGDARIVAVKQ